MPKKPKMGRPKLKPAEKRREIVQFRLTDGERAECEAAAHRAGVNFSAWIRHRLLSAARHETQDA
jgi:hypothetical protein